MVSIAERAGQSIGELVKPDHVKPNQRVRVEYFAQIFPDPLDPRCGKRSMYVHPDETLGTIRARVPTKEFQLYTNTYVIEGGRVITTTQILTPVLTK